jgi:hypothetical protein
MGLVADDGLKERVAGLHLRRHILAHFRLRLNEHAALRAPSFAESLANLVGKRCEVAARDDHVVHEGGESTHR